ncbi:hypothetical protein DER46DRAFT_681578 [Fusarium sp. MPI-SDFR-AT-0072]|nr:hypothetical protein DER46DRAFT_681578 [Fusarium sp. MPI-SDFR-AT-0072]
MIPLTEALQMLRNDGRDIEGEDLSTGDEVRLGELVKQKYMTDYYILDKLPAHTRPFYTNRAEGTQWANPFNIFLRARWICTGGQRIHDEQNIRKTTTRDLSPDSTSSRQLTGVQASVWSISSRSFLNWVTSDTPPCSIATANPFQGAPPASCIDTDTTKPELRNNEPVRHDGGGPIGWCSGLMVSCAGSPELPLGKLQCQ